MFQRNKWIWRTGLFWKSSSVASNQVIEQTRWYNKGILRKGYSVPRDFSWIENYKLITSNLKTLLVRWIMHVFIKCALHKKIQWLLLWLGVTWISQHHVPYTMIHYQKLQLLSLWELWSICYLLFSPLNSSELSFWSADSQALVPIFLYHMFNGITTKFSLQ